jgi:cytidine deaminase
MYDNEWQVNYGIAPSIIERVTDLDRFIPADEHLDRFGAALEYLLIRAREIAQRADSYRGFKVGCAMYAFRRCPENLELLGSRWKIFCGYNTKPTKDSLKICAEHRALMSARQAGYTRIVGMAVVGDPQPDDSGILHPTLHPCKMCIDMFRHAPEVKGRTAIVTAHLQETEVMECFPFAQLNRRY